MIDYATGQIVTMRCDPDKYHWMIIEICVDINDKVKFKVSNGVMKRKVYEHEIEPVAEADEKKIGFFKNNQ